MIQLAGLRPNEDIEVRITGTRPGEKLFEEIALDGEDMLPTDHPKIGKLKGSAGDPEVIAAWLNQLQLLITRHDVRMILEHLTVLVPEYKPRLLQESTRPGKLRAAAAGGSRDFSTARLTNVSNRSPVFGPETTPL
jgi:FlaA1/EpsC-like NDP-sugar epimerase